MTISRERIEPGQVWADTQAGVEGRTVRVVAVDGYPPNGDRKVTCELVTAGPHSSARPGRKSRPSYETVQRCYRLVQHADGTEAGAS